MFPAVAGCALALSAAAHADVPSDTIADLRAALAESDADTSTLTRLVMMLREMGDHAQADALLADLAKSGVELDLLHDLNVDPIPGYEVEVERGAIGPDVIVGDLNGIGYYNQAGGIANYAIGTTSCNIGDTILLWISGNNQHPVIGQNIYRLKDGVFEQIAISHLKHGFTALSGNVCAQCTGPGGPQLSPGCSDPYSTGLNAGQFRLGPRWQVNAYTGAYPYPFFSAPYDSTIGRRAQALVSDVDPNQNAGAVYWGEGQYITADDAQAGNGLNNASYRRVQFNTSLPPFFVGATVRTQPAIHGWKDYDGQVDLQLVDVPGEGRFYVASRAYDNGDGTWKYAYAVHNLNSDRSGQAFSVSTGGAALTDVGFHSPFYHSGDGINGVTYPNDDWAFSGEGGNASWSAPTFAQDQNANALRWGTTYSFWFTSTAAPTTSTASLTLFKPGAPGAMSVQVVAPAGCALTADTNGDNVVNFADLNAVLGAFGQSGAGNPADVNGDMIVNFSDLNAVLAEFGLDCN